MEARSQTSAARSVDEAIGRVLSAEQTARDAVAACARDADTIRQSARARARRIAERAAERVAAVHRWTEAKIRSRVDDLNRERVALMRPAASPQDEPARIARALDCLVEEVSGGSA
jgi:hypothetical protein